MADAEIPAVISTVFNSLDIGDFTIRISNRKILTGYLEHLGFEEGDASAILRDADKIERQGTSPLLQTLETLSGGKAAQDDILSLVQLSGNPADVLRDLNSIEGGERFRTGVDELNAVFEHATAFGIAAENISADIGHSARTGLLHRHHLRNPP